MSGAIMGVGDDMKVSFFYESAGLGGLPHRSRHPCREHPDQGSLSMLSNAALHI